MPQSNNRQLRIAFPNMAGARWTAGLHYLRNLFAALKSLDYHGRPEIALLVSHQTQPNSNNNLNSYVDQLLCPPKPALWQRLVGRIQRRLGIGWSGLESPLGPYLREHQIDCIFAATEFGPRFNVPLLTWIPDFQHLHLPEMFPPETIRGRDEKFSRVADHADRVILSSRDALRDFERFAPQSAHKARILSFVAQVPEDIYDSDPAWVCDYYHLPRRFIYLPNQFWNHKNHGVVVEALTLLKARHREITVVCTGNTNEFRDPLYFAKLLATISERNLRNNLIILGFVPYGHLFKLMRQSLAVLQPSLFEGWSTVVEESKSVGKSVILSDIPVHLEQDPPQAIFFDPYRPEQLADCLVRISDEKKPGPDHELEALAQKQLPERTREYGRTFMEIVAEVLSV